MKAPTRIPFLNYTSMATTLLTDSKSLEIKFRGTHVSAIMLSELADLFSWCALHSEVQSLFITCFGEHFLQGFNPEELRALSEEEVKNLHHALNVLTHQLMGLPQTTVVDLKKGARSAGLELALAADIRLCLEEAHFSFDYLAVGLVPTCGLFSFMRPYLNQNILRSLLLSGREFDLTTLIQLGGWCEQGLDQKTVLENIFHQAPVARMQTKRGLLGANFNERTDKHREEKKIFSSVVVTCDYQRSSGFMGPKAYKDFIRNPEL